MPISQNQNISMNVIARIHSDFSTKFGVPRQSGMIESLKSTIIFEPVYRNPDAFRGLSEFSHIWLVWLFDQAIRSEWSPTVRPPRLGGNERRGVFSTRSPFRPNHIGLSCVRLDSIEFSKDQGPILHISGADLMDHTPILDIKPYIPYADCRPEATGGFTDSIQFKTLTVNIPDEILHRLPEDKRDSLISVLANDPRPSYQHDPDRIYGFVFAGWEIRFSVKDEVLSVLSAAPSVSLAKDDGRMNP